MKNLYVLLLFLSFSLIAQKQLPNLNLLNIEGKSISLKNDFNEQDKLYIFSFVGNLMHATHS